MFPNQNTTFTQEELKQAPIQKKSFKFDFATGDFIVEDGRVKETQGLEYLKMWIEKILKTEKNKFRIYDKYGVNLLDVVNSNNSYNYKKSEIERRIRETLTQNVDIQSLDNFIFTRDGHNLKLKFDVISIWGVSEQEVKL